MMDTGSLAQFNNWLNATLGVGAIGILALAGKLAYNGINFFNSLAGQWEATIQNVAESKALLTTVATNHLKHIEVSTGRTVEMLTDMKVSLEQQTELMKEMRDGIQKVGEGMIGLSEFVKGQASRRE